MATPAPAAAAASAVEDDLGSSAAAQTFKVLALGSVYIATSAGLITFNKYLMTEGGFPYSVPLVSIHMFCSTILSSGLFLLYPSLFTSLKGDGRSTVKVDFELYAQRLLPASCAFAAGLIASNQAYLYSSVAFLQMMKEMNVVLVYACSLLAALEAFSLNHIKVVCLLVLASILTVKGEIHFSLIGFLVQGSGQIFETVRIVLQQSLLTSAGLKLDALSFVLLVSPVCLLVLSGTIASLHVLWPDGALKVPQWSELVLHRHVLLGNALLAFILNLTIAAFIKNTSAVGFILAGIVKDAAIVLAGVAFFRETVTAQQMVGFTIQLACIVLWSCLKTFPHRFRNGILPGILRPQQDFVEAKRLLPKYAKPQKQ
mmetsp:Transcript_72493/g.172826  ORF Transcript_72493/g.172826 Transcript_72493/m.172826 type:complete len:371 (-) Transcript_72493:144-1256(-)